MSLEKMPSMLSAGGTPEEEIGRLKRELEEEIERLKRELEEEEAARKKAERHKEALQEGVKNVAKSREQTKKELSYDGLLENFLVRRCFYMEINKRITELINSGIGQDENEMLDIIAKSNLISVDIDANFLSKYNDDDRIKEEYNGREGGDLYLQSLAKKITKSGDENSRDTKLIEKGRLGGDEMGVLFQGSLEDAEEIMEEAKSAFKGVQIKGSDLEPSFSYGMAHISEAVEAFRQIYEEEERTKILRDPKEAANIVQRLFTSIGEQRGYLTKVYERIILITSLLKEDREKLLYNFSWLNKKLNKDISFYEGLMDKSEQEIWELVLEQHKVKDDDGNRSENGVVGKIALEGIDPLKKTF